MKKGLLLVVLTILLVTSLVLASCYLPDEWGVVYTYETAHAKAQELGYTGSLQEFIDSIKGKDGADGADGIGILSVKVNEQGNLVVTLTNNTVVDCGSIKGPQGEVGPQGPAGEPGKDGVDGEDGKDGTTPQLKIGEDNYWYVSYDNGITWESLGVKATGENGTDGQPGSTGPQGPQGEAGKGISSIVKTSSDGLIDTYTITFTDGSTTTFTVANGQDGTDGQPGEDSATSYVDVSKHNILPGIVQTQAFEELLNDSNIPNKTFVFGDGTYVFDSTIDLPSNVTLVGGSNTILKLAEESQSTVLINIVGVDNVKLFNLKLCGDNLARPSSVGNRSAIWLESSRSVTLDNLDIYGWSKHGIYGKTMSSYGNVADGKLFKQLQLTNSRFYFNYYGTYFDYRCEYSQVSDCVFGENYTGSVNCGGNNLYNNCMWNANYYGFVLENNGSNPAHGTCSSSTFNHNYSHAILVTNCVNGWTFTGCQVFYGKIELSRSIGVIFDANIWGSCSFISTYAGNLGKNIISDTYFLTDRNVILKNNDGSTKVDNCLPDQQPEQEEHFHSFTEWEYFKVPTCEEKGIQFRFCQECSYTQSKYVDLLDHNYIDGYCSECNIAHPNFDNYKGKVVSILGDSISTFAGYIPTSDGFNLEHLARYPQDNLLTDVNETWWMQVINELDAKLGINDSWRGSTVSGGVPVTSGTTGENAAMSNLIRIQNLGSNGTPDIILFYGGTNDLAHIGEVGTFSADNAPSVVDLHTTKWDNLVDAYVNTLLRLKHYYPNSEVICLLPTYTKSYYSDTKLANCNEILATVCNYYNIKYVDLRYCGISVSNLPDGIHPDSAGMDYISKSVINLLIDDCDISCGENIVHKISNNLTNVTSSLGHYKGVSNNMSYKTIIEGDIVDVSVKMGGEDITDQCYFENVINIENVTGDVVIDIVGKEKLIYEDYIIKDIGDFCVNTNLWEIAQHNEKYYDGNNWIVHSSSKVYSITIPVVEGYQIWATSFQGQGNNGGSIDGIRVTWFSENGVIKSLSPSETHNEVLSKGYLVAPQGATAVNIPVWNNGIDNEIYVLNRDHVYVDNICISCGDACVDFSQLTFTAFGDSITYGADLIIGGRVENPYPTVVNEILGLKSYDNRGVSGATLVASNLGLDCMTNRITSYNGQADIIGVLGGVNDFNRNLPLGDVDDNDTSTIYGALHVGMKYLSENYSESFVFYMTPYKQYFHGVLWSDNNSQGYNLQDVANAIKEVAAIYNIPVLDLLAEGGFENVMYDDDCDGVHPNQNFITNNMAPQIAEFIKENYQQQLAK